MPDTTLNSINATLSRMVKQGRAYVDGKMECKHCGAIDTCYRLTEQGRIEEAERQRARDYKPISR